MSAPRTVFLTGIPFTASDEVVQEALALFGPLASLKLPKFQNSTNNLGYGHAEFQSKDDAAKALAGSPLTIGDRQVLIQAAKGVVRVTPEQIAEKKKLISESTTTVFVKNLPYTTTENEVGDFFKPCGKIQNVRFVYNSTDNTFKGFAYIDFESHQSLYAALGFNGRSVGGREITVDVETAPPRPQYKQRLSTASNSKYNAA
jgi:RNA recognition motif-containing protein